MNNTLILLKPRVIDVERLRLLIKTLNTNVVKDIYFKFENTIELTTFDATNKISAIMDMHVIIGNSYYIIKNIDVDNLEWYVDILKESGIKVYTTMKEKE